MADQIPTNVASADEPALAAAANNTVGTSSVFGVSSLPQASVAVSSGPTAAQIANNDAHVHQATLVNHLASGQTLITAINELMHETQNQPHLHHYPPTAPTVQAQEPVPDAPSSQYYATHGLTNQIVQGWNPDDNAHDIVATALGLLEEAQGLIITLQMGGWNGQLNMLNHMLEDLSSLRLGQSVPVASREAVLSFVAGLERVDVESLAGDDKGCGICRGRSTLLVRWGLLLTVV